MSCAVYIHVYLLQVVPGVSGKNHDDTTIEVFSHHSLSLPALQSNTPRQCVTYTVHYSMAMHTRGAFRGGEGHSHHITTSHHGYPHWESDSGDISVMELAVLTDVVMETARVHHPTHTACHVTERPLTYM